MKRKKISIIIVLAMGIVISTGLIGCNEQKNADNNNNYAVSAANEDDKQQSNKHDGSAAEEAEIKDKEEEEKAAKQAELATLEEIKNDDLFMLVNRQNELDPSYEPLEIKECDFDFISYIVTTTLDKRTADAAKEMFLAAEEDGIKLLGASGYRSYSIQESLYNGRAASLGVEEADKYTARPGQSEHQTGLALDILSEDYQEMDDGFENTASYTWLVNNCYKYGFILRYPKGKEDITGYLYEPWHFRYIGNAEIAKEIMDRGLTFEEYLSEVNEKIKILEQE